MFFSQLYIPVSFKIVGNYANIVRSRFTSLDFTRNFLAWQDALYNKEIDLDVTSLDSTRPSILHENFRSPRPRKIEGRLYALGHKIDNKRQPYLLAELYMLNGSFDRHI